MGLFVQLEESFVGHSCRTPSAALYAQHTYELSQQQAGRLLAIGNSSLRHRLRQENDSELCARLRALAAERRASATACWA
jgi:hypothetical protein